MDAALISIDELNDLIYDADGNYISKEAEALEAIDNGIFFYVSREELQLPDKELAGTVIKHLGGEKQVEKQADRNCLYARLSQVTQEIIDAICGIKTVPDGLLPHTVFVEEVNEKGAPYYRRYQMVDIDRVDGNCIIYDNDTDYQEEISLQAINVDWLITFWNRYLELSADVETEQTPGNTNPLEYALRLLLDVALHEIPCFEQSQTFTICNDALNGINRVTFLQRYGNIT